MDALELIQIGIVALALLPVWTLCFLHSVRSKTIMYMYVTYCSCSYIVYLSVQPRFCNSRDDCNMLPPHWCTRTQDERGMENGMDKLSRMTLTCQAISNYSYLLKSRKETWIKKHAIKKPKCFVRRFSGLARNWMHSDATAFGSPQWKAAVPDRSTHCGSAFFLTLRIGAKNGLGSGPWKDSAGFSKETIAAIGEPIQPKTIGWHYQRIAWATRKSKETN